jgi:hypothetical protein
VKNAHLQLQYLLDDVLRAPVWFGALLLILAVAITALGRRGQRPLNAFLLAAAGFFLAFFGLKSEQLPWLAGVVAVIALVLLGLFGIVATSWGTAAVVGATFSAAAALLAHLLKLPLWGIAALGFGFGLFVGMVHQKRIAIYVPPVLSAVFAALGAGILWAPHRRGAMLWRLNDVDWMNSTIAVLFVPLLALAILRERLRQQKLLARTQAMDDEELKQRLAAARGG